MDRKLRFVLASISIALVACVSARTDVPAAEQPAFETMSPAEPTSKISVPADVRYRLSAAATPDQPMIVDVAIVPRVTGANLKIEFPPSASISVEAGASAFIESKAVASNIYRRSLSVTPKALASAEVRVLVSMDVDGGRYFGVFRIPLSPQAAQKGAPVRNQ